MLYKLLSIDSKEPVQYAGVYVTKWGRTDQPEVLFREATPGEIAEAFEREKNSIALENQVQAKQSFWLRSVPIHDLNTESVKSMLKKNDFHDEILNRSVRGWKHLYAVVERGNIKVIYDWLTSLMWQQGGSQKMISFAEGQEYIAQLNREKFAGYDDWRLPTLEEAMSLMEPEGKNGGLYIDPVFDNTQRWIWAADEESAGVAWYVDFYFGYCSALNFGNDIYVRAVRSGQS